MPLPRAELELSPARVVVGDSVEVVVHLHHVAGERVELTSEGFDYSWVILGRAGSVTTTDEAAAHTTYRFTLASLEPGERELPTPVFRMESGSQLDVALATPPTVDVGGLLAETEDAPRPIVGFLEPSAPPSGWAWGWAALPLLLLVALAWWFARRRRARAVPVAPRLTPLQRLAALEARDLAAADEPGFAADLHVELTRLVREDFDLRVGGAGAGTRRDSLTDDEWLAVAALELSEEQRVALHALFLESREIKYGGARPTHWALEESLAAARAVLTSAPELAPQLVEASA